MSSRFLKSMSLFVFALALSACGSDASLSLEGYWVLSSSTESGKVVAVDRNAADLVLVKVESGKLTLAFTQGPGKTGEYFCSVPQSFKIDKTNLQIEAFGSSCNGESLANFKQTDKDHFQYDQTTDTAPVRTFQNIFTRIDQATYNSIVAERIR